MCCDRCHHAVFSPSSLQRVVVFDEPPPDSPSEPDSDADDGEFDEEEVVSVESGSDSGESGSQGSEASNSAAAQRRLTRRTTRASRSRRRSTRRHPRLSSEEEEEESSGGSGGELRAVPSRRSSQAAARRMTRLIEMEEEGSDVGLDEEEEEEEARPKPSRARAVTSGATQRPRQGKSQATPLVHYDRRWLQVVKTCPWVYVPQVGDKVVYFPQGHAQALQSAPSKLPPPWTAWPRAWSTLACVVESVGYRFPDGDERVEGEAPSIVCTLDMRVSTQSSLVHSRTPCS